MDAEAVRYETGDTQGGDETPLILLAQEIERARIEAGLTTAELMAGLREQRKRYYAEQYANALTSNSCCDIQSSTH